MPSDSIPPPTLPRPPTHLLHLPDTLYQAPSRPLRCRSRQPMAPGVYEGGAAVGAGGGEIPRPGSPMSLRAMEYKCCEIHGEHTLFHYSQCTSCGVVLPTQVTDSTTSSARARKQRHRLRMAKARAGKVGRAAL